MMGAPGEWGKDWASSQELLRSSAGGDALADGLWVTAKAAQRRPERPRRLRVVERSGCDAPTMGQCERQPTLIAGRATREWGCVPDFSAVGRGFGRGMARSRVLAL